MTEPKYSFTDDLYTKYTCISIIVVFIVSTFQAQFNNILHIIKNV